MKPEHRLAFLTLYRPWRRLARGCLVLALWPALAWTADDEAPPPITVTAAWDAAYVRVNTSYKGHQYLAAENNVQGVERKEQHLLFPDCGAELAAVVTVSATAAGQLRLTATVRDYDDRTLLEIDELITASPDQPATRSIAFTPTAADHGPFYVLGDWRQVDGDLTGHFELAAGQANLGLVLEDFEMMQHPRPGEALQNTAAARHDGDYGMLVRVPPGTAADKPGTQRLPLQLALPGRPVQVSFWLKCNQALTLEAVISDPGFPALQRTFPDQWTIGPLQIAAGDWRQVQLPMPGYGRSRALHKSYGEGDGVVDYPLTLGWLAFSAVDGAEVSVDQFEVRTQETADGSVRVRTVRSRPGELLYPSDIVILAAAQPLLRAVPGEARLVAELQDIAGGKWPLLSQAVSLTPGAETRVTAAIDGLPIGSYELAGSVTAADGTATPLPPARFVVYLPGGQALAPEALCALISQRERLVADLGFGEELMALPWHSVDGSLSVEPVGGYWTFDWLEPEVAKREEAGLQIAGLLGFTPIWADPSATYNRGMQAWYGNVYVKPSRQGYWQEYVRRTAERFKDKIKTWVIWDRPDSPAFKATPQEFAEEMLAVAHAALTRADPEARIISGGITRGNIDSFLVGLAEARAQTYLDGIGILPSTTPLSPEDGYLDVILARAQRLRESEHIDTPLWVLNLGWPSGPESHQVSEADQARFLARAFIICRASGIRDILLRPDHSEAIARRDTADLIYQEGAFFGLKPAALVVKPLRSLLLPAEPVREVFLNDQQDGLSRAFLFRQTSGRLILAAWRIGGESWLPLTPRPADIIDMFGNSLAIEETPTELRLAPEPHYLIYPPGDPQVLIKHLERLNLRFEDAAESRWKGQLKLHLDVGDPEDEAAADYHATDSRQVGPVASNYHNPQGRYVVDTGRHIRGEERFTVDVSDYGDAGMILRKRLNYAVPHQRVKVYCDGELTGQWFAFKTDRRYKWRNAEYVIANRFLRGKSSVELRFVTQGDSEATSYYYWIGPLTTQTLYISDLSQLVSTSLYGGGMSRDCSIIGTPLRFANDPTGVFRKGIGSQGAASLTDSLLVLSLNKQFRRFRATVGIDAATNGKGSVVFRVRDGKSTLFDSGSMSSFTAPKEIDLDVSDAVLLMLWVDDNGDGSDNDLADWADARLELK